MVLSEADMGLDIHSWVYLHLPSSLYVDYTFDNNKIYQAYVSINDRFDNDTRVISYIVAYLIVIYFSEDAVQHKYILHSLKMIHNFQKNLKNLMKFQQI